VSSLLFQMLSLFLLHIWRYKSARFHIYSLMA
jgi:hypothetical protein